MIGFDWDEANSQRNRVERGLPFIMAVARFGEIVVD